MGLDMLKMAAFLAVQLGSAASVESTARLFVHLMNQGLLRERQGLWHLSWMTDPVFLEEVAACGVAAPCCPARQGPA